MKKIVKIVEKYDNILLYIYMICALSVYVFAVKFTIGDELWLFSFVYKFTNGYEMYRDLNILTTPLFHYIGKIIFLILGSNYISFRIYSILIFSALFTAIYVLFKKLKIKKMHSFVYILLIYLVFLIKKYFSIGASYNFLVVTFVIIGINLELNEKNKLINSILKGLILFCIFMTKQNVAVLYTIALSIIFIIKIKKRKISIKEAIKNVSIIFTSFIIPLIIFIIYLQINNTLGEFISYCFLGMKEFGSKNIFLRLDSIPVIVVYAVGIIISCLVIKKKNIDREIKKVNYILIPVEIIMMFLAFPILDEYHILVGAIIPIISIIYNFHNILILEINNKKAALQGMKACIIIISLYIVCYNSMRFYMYKNSDSINYDIEPYIGIIIDDTLKEKITTICNYIRENEKLNIETKIISADAQLYMNVLKKNNKNMDLSFLGNLGKDGEEGLILEVRNLKQGTRILISKTKLSWQDPEKLRNVIMNEFNKIGEIEDYYIYGR